MIVIGSHVLSDAEKLAPMSIEIDQVEHGGEGVTFETKDDFYP